MKNGQSKSNLYSPLLTRVYFCVSLLRKLIKEIDISESRSNFLFGRDNFIFRFLMFVLHSSFLLIEFPAVKMESKGAGRARGRGKRVNLETPPPTQPLGSGMPIPTLVSTIKNYLTKSIFLDKK